VLVSGYIGLGQERQCVVDSCQLRCLADLLLRGFSGALDNRLSDFPCEGLVGVGLVAQFASQPCFRYFLVSGYSIVHIPCSIS